MSSFPAPGYFAVLTVSLMVIRDFFGPGTEPFTSSRLFSRPTMPAAATGPGVGGMNTCEANKPAASANINGTGDVPDRRASDLPMGLTSTKPLSQNTGIETIHPMSIIAKRG